MNQMTFAVVIPIMNYYIDNEEEIDHLPEFTD